MDLITPINDLIHEEPGSLCILTGLKLGKPKKRGYLVIQSPLFGMVKLTLLNG